MLRLIYITNWKSTVESLALFFSHDEGRQTPQLRMTQLLETFSLFLFGRNLNIIPPVWIFTWIRWRLTGKQWHSGFFVSETFLYKFMVSPYSTKDDWLQIVYKLAITHCIFLVRHKESRGTSFIGWHDHWILLFLLQNIHDIKYMSLPIFKFKVEWHLVHIIVQLYNIYLQ